MATLTITLPTVGGDEDTWGATLNTNLTNIDNFIGALDSAELAVLDGITATTAELNILDGVTATTADINQLDGTTITAYAKTLLDDASASTARSTLGLGNLAPLDILDEDDFATNSPSRPPSQQSTKAYVDNEITDAIADNPSTVSLISRTVISGTPSELDVTFDPSLYDVIEIELANVVPTSNLVGFLMRTSSDGGATFDSGASDYASSITTFTMGAASSNEGGSSGTNDIDLTGNVGSAGGENGVSLSIKIIGPNLAQRTFIKFGGGWMDAGGNYVETNGAAYRKTAAIVNAVRFFFSSGNLESGVVTVYGKRNS